MRLRLISSVPLKKQLLKFLSDNPGMNTLDLSDNQLGIADQKELCEMMTSLQGSEIEHLILSGTALGYKSGDELNELMGCLQETNISSIDLTNNFFGIQNTISGLEQLLSGLEKTKVKNLDFTDNHLDLLNHDELSNVFSIYNQYEIENIHRTFSPS